jgi:chromosome segregation ATPase
MKFPKISAAVPQGEHFDESAVNEGVWLSENHLNSIENALSVSEKNAAEVATSLETANASINTLTEQLATEKENVTKVTTEKEASDKKITDLATEHATALEAKDAKIAKLEAEIVVLGKKPSGTGSAVVTTEDENAEDPKTGKTGLLDPEHPLNQYASAKVARAKKSKK